jgi:hypothetical protein
MDVMKRSMTCIHVVLRVVSFNPLILMLENNVTGYGDVVRDFVVFQMVSVKAFSLIKEVNVAIENYEIAVDEPWLVRTNCNRSDACGSWTLSLCSRGRHKGAHQHRESAKKSRGAAEPCRFR